MRAPVQITRRQVLKGTAALAAFGAGVALLRRWEQRPIPPGPETSGDAGVPSSQPACKERVWDGRTYRQKSDVESYLFLGIDVMGPATGAGSYIAGGQADAQILLVLDHQDRTWQLLQINRDSMVEVPVLGMMGRSPYTVVQQIALAHAYGDGLEESCENSAAAVSMMLEDQPIDGYFAMNMGGVEVLVDQIGGVTLTVQSDFSAVDPTLTEGETLTLDGRQALAYVRTRKDVDDQTNLARMERQRQFLAALEQKACTLDADLAARVWQALADYVVTDIPSGTAARAAQCLRDYTRLPLLTIAGENRVEDGYWAYYLDQDSLQQVILQLFYTEI